MQVWRLYKFKIRLMKNSSKSYLLPLALATSMAVGLWMGHFLSPNSKGFQFNTEEGKYGKVKDIIELLDSKYVDKVNGDKLFEQTISDMLHKLDPHSNYIPAQDLKSAKESIEGRFGGIGVRFSIIRDTICVTNVIFGSPSFQAGIQSGDKIISVDRKPISKMKITNEKVMKLLKGPEQTSVTVEVIRNGKNITKKLIRGIIPIESVVCATMLSENIGYIKLDQFSLNSSMEFNKAALSLKRRGMTKLIFDLRNNGGGVLQGAAEIVDEFLESGKVIVKTKGSHSKETVYKATSRGALVSTDVVVLINSNSASASEIVAGALQDNDRATIMGRRSFGKGLVQEDIMLKDGSNLRLTVARYYTPTGRCIQKPYTENYETYYQDQLERYENGELYKIDSSLLVDSLKFKTPKGKTVYGGGGILPDVFIPVDTTGLSWYYTDLRYNPVFQNFAFDFLQGKRETMRSLASFVSSFEVSDKMLNEFVRYAEDNFGIPLNVKGLKTSKQVIKSTIKSEIARQLWMEQGYYTVMSKHDKEIIKAFKFLNKKK
jgi:carboxyl-terminal processing protease